VRGRRLCYELAQRSARGDEIRIAMSALVHRVHEQRGVLGRSVSCLVAENAGGSVPEPPPARALAEVLTGVASAMTLGPDDLLAALSETVSSAMYWQPPHADDVVLARSRIRSALAPIADVVLAAPGARWWSTPLDRDAQIATRFERSTVSEPLPGTAAERLHQWRDAVVDQERSAARHRAKHPSVPTGGTWWVTPALAGLDATTRAHAGARLVGRAGRPRRRLADPRLVRRGSRPRRGARQRPRLADDLRPGRPRGTGHDDDPGRLGPRRHLVAGRRRPARRLRPALGPRGRELGA
jgi:hypothetical protein